MAQRYLFIVLITLGVLIVFQGQRLIRLRGKAHIYAPERVILTLMSGAQPEEQMKALGRIRVVIGLALAAIGIWALI